MLFAMVSAQAFAQAPANITQATDLAFIAFGKACAPNVGNAAGMETEIKAEGFLPAPPVIADQLSKDRSEAVWLFPGPDIGVSVLTKPGGLSCRVFLQRGDLTKLTSEFRAVIQGVAGPLLVVKKVSDQDVGPLHILAFRVHKDPQPAGSADRAFALTVNRSANSGVAAIITSAAVKQE
jgi:hypothetical protein